MCDLQYRTVRLHTLARLCVYPDRLAACNLRGWGCDLWYTDSLWCCVVSHNTGVYTPRCRSRWEDGSWTDAPFVLRDLVQTESGLPGDIAKSYRYPDIGAHTPGYLSYNHILVSFKKRLGITWSWLINMIEEGSSARSDLCLEALFTGSV